MLPRTVTVSAESLSWMLHVQHLGQPHVILRPSPVWRDSDGERSADTAMWNEFARAELLDHRRHLNAGTLNAFRTLGRADSEYLAIYTDGTDRHGVLVAETSGETVLAHRHGDVIALTSLPNHAPADALVGQLPNHAPARIDALNAHVDDVADLRHDALDAMPTQHPDSHAVRDAESLANLAHEPLLGQGELYVEVHDPMGRHRRTHNPIRYEDRPSGRVLVILTAHYVSIASGTPQLVASKLRESHDDLMRHL
jgi:hypothetical protein